MSSPSCGNACSVMFSRIARFSNVQHLSVHISKNFGAENTRVYYIGLRGEYSEAGSLALIINLIEVEVIARLLGVSLPLGSAARLIYAVVFFWPALWSP